MLSDYIEERKQALTRLPELESVIDNAGEWIIASLLGGHKLLTCGNGGSAAEAQHFSTELIGRFKGSERPSLPAICLNADGSAITCIANDFGGDAVFSRQVEGFAQQGDLLAVFSSSGNSANIRHALKAAGDRGIRSIAFLGKGGGACKGQASLEIIIPSDSTAVVQELHLLLIHYLCEQIEEAFTERPG